MLDAIIDSGRGARYTSSAMLAWLLLALCVGLTAALAWTLRELYRLRFNGAAQGPRMGAPPMTLGRLDELVTMLLGLHELSVADVGPAARGQVGRAVLDCACALMGSTRGSLMLFDDESGTLRIAASRGLSQEVVETTRLKPGMGVAGRAFELGQPIFIAEPEKDPRYVQWRAAPESQEPFVSIPLKIRQKPVGVLNLHQTEGTLPFGDYNLKFLTLLASEAAKSFENLNLYDNLQTFYMDLVKALARALDMKDQYTHEHGERAKKKARRIAEELGLPEQMVRYVEFAALLHDMGKIGIDDAIITKPGKLTPEEYEIMKKHPEIGFQILQPVKFMGPVAQIVLYHQEWYNGQGYPEGLKGEEIPLGSRVVAVIDAWDAMTSDRPYRRALGRDKAISELRHGAGTQFDPKVVEVFLRIEEREWSQDPTIPLPDPKLASAGYRLNAKA